MDKLLKEDQPKTYYEYVFKNKSNQIKSDFEISLNDKVLRVHKKVLAQQNPVFLEKFISQPEVTKVEILDFDSMAVAIFINYLYTGQLSDGDVSEDLFRVADKYLDFKLKNICREKFLKMLTFGNAAKRLLFFLYQGESQLLKETSVFIARNFNDVKLRPDFNLVLEKKEAVDAVLDVFDECKIAVLSEDKHPTREKLMESAKKSDLTVKVQNHSFLGHKKVLSTRNSVFKSVIAALPTSGLSSSVNIPDFSAKTFKIFLEYIYTRNVDKKDVTKELLDVAYNYVNSKLQKICEEELLSTICEENAAELLILSANIGSEKLKAETSKFIAEKYAEIKERDDFWLVKQHPEAVEAILNQFAARVESLYESEKNRTNAISFKGTVSLKVPVTAGRKLSEEFSLGKIPWKILAEITESNKKYVGLFLYCTDKNVSFEHNVNFTLRLISSTGQTHKRYGPGTKTFSSTKPLDSWGSKNYIHVSDLNDEKKGLMKNGIIKVEVEVKFVD